MKSTYGRMLAILWVTNLQWLDRNAPISRRAHNLHHNDKLYDIQMYNIHLHANHELDPVVGLF